MWTKIFKKGEGIDYENLKYIRETLSDVLKQYRKQKKQREGIKLPILRIKVVRHGENGIHVTYHERIIDSMATFDVVYKRILATGGLWGVWFRCE